MFRSHFMFKSVHIPEHHSLQSLVHRALLQCGGTPAYHSVYATSKRQQAKSFMGPAFRRKAHALTFYVQEAV